MIAALLIVALVVVVVGLTAATMLTLRRQRERFASANEVVPGVPTTAPAAWAGSHDPEARLHRRLRDAMTALRSAPAALDGAGLDLRVELEQQALALDEGLVAIAAAPAAHREAPLARATGAVEQLEAAVAEVATAGVGETADRLEQARADVRRQRVTLEEIRAELDGPSTLPRLDDTSSPPDPEASPGV